MSRWSKARRIAAVLGHLLVGAARYPARRLWARLGRSGETPARTIGRGLAETLVELGPTYIKVGQILSTRADLFGPEVTQELEPLVDRLPAPAFSEVEEAITGELGRPIAEAFDEFEAQPVASASIASVYRARLDDGRWVAVKVRRPGIEREVALDLSLLKTGARWLARMPGMRSIPVQAAVDDLSKCIEGQLDFHREAEANERLAQALQWESAIRIPSVVHELSGRAVLTMGFIEGLQDAGTTEPGSSEALVSALNGLYRMIFVEGLIHCDLHNGNLHFLDDGTVAMIDFGFVADFPYEDRLRFAEFFYTMVSNDGQGAAEITLELASFVPPKLDRDQFTSEIVELVDRVSGRPAREFLVADFVAKLFDIQRRHRVQGTVAFTMAIVSLLVFEGMVQQVDPDLDFQERAKPFILRASARRSEEGFSDPQERLEAAGRALNALRSNGNGLVTSGQDT